MDTLLQTLVGTPGIPGHEHLVRAVVEEALPAGLTRELDAMGNLVVSLGSGEPTRMFVAHMDEIGFLVSEVREDGFLRIKPLGGIDPRTVLGRRLRIVGARGAVDGVVGVVPPHLMRDRAKEMSDVPAVDRMLVDIGARSLAEADALGVRVLDQAVLRKDPGTLGAHLWCARALDDRVGCWVLVKAIERLMGGGHAGTVRFGFSVQEEIGLRGAELLARRLAPEYAFAVDSVSSADFPEVDASLSPARLGEGPCLRVVDNATVIPPAFRDEVAAVAEAAGIPLQIVFSGGGTDAKPFQAVGAHVISLAFPLRYTHSSVELVHRHDAAQLVDLVCALARG